MNLLREKFCEEINRPMGLDDIYDYVKWLENKFQQEQAKNKYSEEEVLDIIALFVNDEPHDTKEWFKQFKKK